MFQVWPHFVISDSTPLLQELRDPSSSGPGPGPSARWVMLAEFVKVLPIHLHFHLKILVSIGSSTVLSRSVSFVILSVQLIFIVRVRHLLAKDCDFWVVRLVILHRRGTLSHWFLKILSWFSVRCYFPCLKGTVSRE